MSNSVHAIGALARQIGVSMHRIDKPAFDPTAFLASAGVGRRIVQLRKSESLFSQGDIADSVFYIQRVRAKLVVVSGSGREAAIFSLIRRRLCGRRVDNGSGRPSFGRSDCNTERFLRAVFKELYSQRVKLEGMILKPGMVLPGVNCPHQETVEEVADATVGCLFRSVPAAVPGIVFLSSGQSGELASVRVNAMNIRYKSRLPWQAPQLILTGMTLERLRLPSPHRLNCYRPAWQLMTPIVLHYLWRPHWLSQQAH